MSNLILSVKTDEMYRIERKNDKKGYTVVIRINDYKMFLIRNCMMSKLFKELD